MTDHSGAPPRHEWRFIMDRGLRQWDQHPRKKAMEWTEGKRTYRLEATNFRFLLYWRWKGRRGWNPLVCRWSDA